MGKIGILPHDMRHLKLAILEPGRKRLSAKQHQNRIRRRLDELAAQVELAGKLDARTTAARQICATRGDPL